ncbi:hypothetical protein DPMN_124205 [Dreissena polymorpha]|uniref:Uncharacterized protein n=1 Tax=Dreissena polymorpha TaxID=45954 RepID=A0A9D4JW12_DREPO|nr:hypothetical protein DPMN_124205 [Dreissena polymorpha]
MDESPKTSCTVTLPQAHLRYMCICKRNLKAIDVNPITWKVLAQAHCNLRGAGLHVGE